MFKIFVGWIAGMLISFSAFYGYETLLNRYNNSRNSIPIIQYEEFKSDFISIPIFRKGRVDGYFSFRILLNLKDSDLSVDVTMFISDLIYRNLAKITDMYLTNSKGADNIEEIKKYINDSISRKYPKNVVTNFDMVDLAYDERID